MPIGRPVNGFSHVLKSPNCDGGYGVALLLGCALLLAPELAGAGGRLLLRYDRDAIIDGQWWRLLTAHVVHLDLEHATLNGLGLALLWALFARDYRPRQWLCIALGACV